MTFVPSPACDNQYHLFAVSFHILRFLSNPALSFQISAKSFQILTRDHLMVLAFAYCCDFVPLAMLSLMLLLHSLSIKGHIKP